MLRYTALQLLLLAVWESLPAFAAERPVSKPWDFRPLTALPWEKEGATQESIMDTIFRDPDATIRYSVLQLYLGKVPVEQIGRVFDLAIELEDSETPDALVESMLRIWAARDPFRCWERVQKLFLVVGLEDGWLMFDDWDVERSSLVVQDRAAIQASPFRLERWSLIGFPVGVESSELPSVERVRLMKEFVQLWFMHFDTYPDAFQSTTDARGDHLFNEAFKVDADGVQSFYEQYHEQEYGFAAATIALRRWMVTEPARASSIMGLVVPKRQCSRYDNSRVDELLRLWAEVDRPGLMKWADSKDTARSLAIAARGLFMSEVNAEHRDRWLSEAKGSDKGDDDLTEYQFECWAIWDPKAALEFAARTGNSEIISAVADAAIDGPFFGSTRLGRLGFDLVKDFDLNTLPVSVRESMLDDWGMSPMENWGNLDAGATARFGIVQLNRYKWYGFPKDEVIQFFAGLNNEHRDNGHVIDRTFCSLRTWAATKPAEMKAWVATLKDDKLREALTWLADNPWGPGRF